MPRKRGSLTPRGGRGGRGAGRGRGRTSGGPPYSSGLPSAGVGFTLADEARQTSQQDHSSWGQNGNLRHKPVSFISAGSSEPLKQLDGLLQVNVSEDGQPARNEAQEGAQFSTEEVVEQQALDEVIGPDELEKAIQPSGNTEELAPFFFDLAGDSLQSKTKASEDPVPIPERAPVQDSSSSSDEVILFKGRDRQKVKTEPATDIIMTQMREEIQVVEEQIRAAPASRASRAGGRKSRARASRRRKAGPQPGPKNDEDDEEDAWLADYIANMRESGEADTFHEAAYNRRDLGGTESEISSGEERPAKAPVKGADIKSVSRPSFVPASGQDQNGVAETTDDIRHSESELDDETLARLIAGEETGRTINGEQTNDLDSDSDSDSDSSSDAKQGSTSRLDACDDFDLMDWERPSLRRKKGKGSRAQITFNVSDSDLEQAMQAAWSNDRLKKSQRKKQREELRALGQLGKKARKPEDLLVKYPTGMKLEQVAEELKTFLLGDDETLQLPPMDKHARKMVHDLANKFSIKSKSAGKADSRRPVLYRTNRTLAYTESTFDMAVSRIGRRYFPRLDWKGKRPQRDAPMRSNHEAASYRDGEIVGAAAPELGTENRGRSMLEKMGWSTGTALGTKDNQGILQPVTHAMKRSKAGLG